jgi:hypothetical protein
MFSRGSAVDEKELPVSDSRFCMPVALTLARVELENKGQPFSARWHSIADMWRFRPL